MQGDILTQVAQVLDAQDMVRPGQTVLVAVSGGADSVALMCLLCVLSHDRGFALKAAYFDHGIRGQASRKDGDFVASLCRQRGVSLVTGYGDVPALARERGLGMEEAAREARRAFLDQTRLQTGAHVIALAHHMEDQAETVLMHLMRGSGLAGLCGMRPVTGCFIRPLLGIHRQALRDYLVAIGQSWREDATNASLDYRRNAVRLRLLPEMAQFNPSVVQALARTAAGNQVDEGFLSDQAEALVLPSLKAMPYGGFFSLSGWGGIHPALIRRRLMGMLGELGAPTPDFDHLLRLEALCLGHPGQQVQLAGGLTACRGRERVHFTLPGGAKGITIEAPLCLHGQTPWAEGRFMARPAQPGEIGDGLNTQVFPQSALAGAVLRTRRAGDRFTPLGAGGSQKLKQTLIDRGIDQPFKALMPLVCRGETVLWIPGIMPSEQARIKPEQAGIHLTFDGKMPWE